MKNLTKILVVILILFTAFLWYRNQNKPVELKNETLQEKNVDQVIVKDLVIKEHGYGFNVIAEIQNLTSKEIKFCEVTFTWYGQDGKLIDSAKGMGKNIKSSSTGIVDRYFDGIPEGATCKAEITDVDF